MVVVWLQITMVIMPLEMDPFVVVAFLAPVCPLVTWEVVIILCDCSKLSVSILFFFFLHWRLGVQLFFSVTETKWHGPPSKVLSSYKERALQKDGSCKDSPNKLSHVSCLHMASHTR